MTAGCYSSGFRVSPTSVAKIRAAAMNVRDMLMPNGTPHLESFVGSLHKFNITVDVVEDNFLLPGVEATCIPEKRVVYISATTYDAIRRNDGRARFTVFHELGHLILAHSRSFHRDTRSGFPIWENSEWQADQFAAEITMPLSVILDKNLTEAWELQDEFGVSYQAACHRLSKLRQKGEIKNA
jgi:Zn-dependent peptidase ImmA (M78 family)